MADLLKDESWEFQNNTSDRMLFKSDDFESMYTDPETQETYPAWKNDFEARFPSDKWENITQLKTFVSWVLSTDRTQATGDDLAEAVTYDGVEYTKDTAEYRLAKFKAEFADYAEVSSFVFYYVFTELFLMVDSRAKNFFLGFHGSTCEIEGMRRKAVAEPYDMDTGLGTNNEGTLTFSYYLEDTDTVAGADVFNGQKSVLWNNLRDTQRTAIVNMYQTLRSQGTLSYTSVETRFEEHQDAWPEAVWNEDANVKYIEPLVNPEGGKEPTNFYLPMAQGDKRQQRRWWMRNRFAYMDSKWNAGDALSQVIQLRGYAKSDITVTPYINLYPTVKYGSYLVQLRGTAGTPATLVCPLDNVDDTEIYIYSAPHIANAGDLSGLKVGVADFSQAVNIQEVKVGDASVSYDNPNMKRLGFGSNVLLKKVDARNCSGLGTDEQKTVDMSNCSIIEEVYFDGTSVQGVTLPNGGVLRILHLPATVTNLTLLNQKNITDLTVAGYSNISTLRIENSSVDSKGILNSISSASRVRLIGFYWECTNAAEIESILDKLDTMRGLDETGGNVDKAQVSGEIHTSSLTGAQIASYNARYPYLKVTADHTSAVISYYNGTTLLTTETVLDGGDGTYTGTTPTKSQDAQYTYTFAGWSKDDDNTVDSDALTNVVADRNVYACFTGTLRKYTVTFVKASADGGGTLQTIQNVAYGTVITAASSYTGSTPTTTQGSATDYPFEGWEPASATVHGNTTFTAKFGSPVEVKEITDSWDTIIANIDNGTYKTVYKVGQYKPLDIGTEGTINMQIAAIDGDELADGSGTAPLSFVGVELLASQRLMASSSDIAQTTGWTDTGLRYTLNSTILPLIPSVVSQRIQTVKKVTQYHNGTTNVDGTTNDKLWVPSYRELKGGNSTEKTGVLYTTLVKGVSDYLKKKRAGQTDYTSWWMRTKFTSATGKWGTFNDSGNPAGTMNSSSARGVCLGFCLGLEPETITDSWETILANENPSATYSIGDTKYVDLGTEGKHLMQIVAFDADDKADGSGKAKITWISKTLLNTLHRMNPANSNGAIGTGGNGGWENCEMRTYLKNTIKPLIPAEVRNAIVEVTKIQSTVTDGAMVKDGQTTTDDVWIPSAHEVGSSNNYESTGAVYTTKFNSSANRVKKHNGSADNWWVRSAGSTTSFRYIYAGGSSGNGNAAATNGVALGFCTD